MTDDPRTPRLVLRGIAAVLLATQGVVHLQLWFDGFRGLPVIGPLFLVGVIAAFALALAVLATNNKVALAAGVLLSLGQIASFATASTVGLFGFQTQWSISGASGAALLSEMLAVVALIALFVWRQRVVARAYA